MTGQIPVNKAATMWRNLRRIGKDLLTHNGRAGLAKHSLFLPRLLLVDQAFRLAPSLICADMCKINSRNGIYEGTHCSNVRAFGQLLVRMAAAVHWSGDGEPCGVDPFRWWRELAVALSRSP